MLELSVQCERVWTARQMRNFERTPNPEVGGVAPLTAKANLAGGQLDRSSGSGAALRYVS